MRVLTTVEKRCLCSAPFNEGVPPLHVNTHTHTHFPSQLSGRLHCECLCNSHNRDLIDLPLKSLQVTQPCAAVLEKSSIIIRPVGKV